MVFRTRLELATGEPPDPPTFETSEPNWRPEHRIFFGPGKPELLVVGLYAGAADDEEQVLIVQPVES